MLEKLNRMVARLGRLCRRVASIYTEEKIVNVGPPGSKKNEDTELAVEKSEGTELAAEEKANTEDTAEVEEKKDKNWRLCTSIISLLSDPQKHSSFISVKHTHTYVLCGTPGPSRRIKTR